MTFSHSVNNYIFDSWRAAKESNVASLRDDALEALAIGNLTGADLRHKPDVDEGLSSLVESAINGRVDLRAVVFRFHEAHERPLSSQVRPLVVSWLADAVAHGRFKARDDLNALGEGEIMSDALTRLRTYLCGIGQRRFDERVACIFSGPLKDILPFLLSSQDSVLNEWNDTILHAAAVSGRLDVVKFILENVDVNELNTRVNAVNRDHETPLLYAARCGHAAIVSFLLAHCADPSILSSHGESPLHYLTSFEDADISEITKLLKSHGADLQSVAKSIHFNEFQDPRIEFGTPLHFAVERNHVRAVASLVEHGADIRSQISQLSIPSPLALAACLHYHEVLECMIRYLIGHNETEDPTIDRASGQSLLCCAIGGPGYGWSVFNKIVRHGRFWKRNAVATLDVLFGAGATNHFASLPGMPHCTAVFLAVQSDDHILDAILRTNKESINVAARVLAGDVSRPPLFEAILYHRFDAFKVLVRHGVDLTGRMDYEGDSITGLYYCAFSRHESTEMADTILHADVGVDEGPEGLETPFICAVRNRAFKLARYFLEQNANPNAFFQRGLFCNLDVPTTLLGILLAETSPAMLGCLNFLLDNVPNLAFTTTTQDNWTVLHRLASLDLWVTRETGDPTLGEILRRLNYYFKPTHDELNQLGTSSENDVTALHLAADFGNFVVADWLVSNGADTSILNRYGLTALDTAYIRTVVPGDQDVVDIPTPVSRQAAQAKAIRREVYECIAKRTPSGVNRSAVARFLLENVTVADE